jgi:hypothetical protein
VLESPKFIQGIFSFAGAGLDEPVPLGPEATHTVAADKRAQLIYLRAGNSTDEMIYLLLTKNQRAMRYFPIGAKNAIHVQLAIVEDIEPESKLDVRIGAAQGVNGSVVVDIGLVEI